MKRFIYAALKLLTLATPILGAPRIDRAIPPVLLIGKTNAVSFQGSKLPAFLSLHSLDHSIPLSLLNANPESTTLLVPPHFPPGPLPLTFATPQGLSNPQIFLMENLPLETIATPATLIPSLRRSHPTPLAIPSGTYAQLVDLEYHYYQIPPQPQHSPPLSIALEIFARRLGSKADPVLKIYKETGTEILHLDDSPGWFGDLIATFQPESGVSYLLEIRDIEYGGGPDSFYYLRATTHPDSSEAPALLLSETEPNNTLSEANVLEDSQRLIGTFQTDRDSDWFRLEVLQAPTTLALHSNSRQHESPLDLRLSLHNGEGRSLGSPSIQDGWDDYWTFNLPSAGSYFLKVENLTQRHSAGFPYHITLQQPAPGFHLFVPKLVLEGSPGQTVELPYTLERLGYEDPIRLEIKGLPPGVPYPETLISGKAKDGKIAFQIPNRLRPAAFYPLELLGAQTNSTLYAQSVRASTLPAWQSAFPTLPFPPLQNTTTFHLSILPPQKD